MEYSGIRSLINDFCLKIAKIYANIIRCSPKDYILVEYSEDAGDK